MDRELWEILEDTYNDFKDLCHRLDHLSGILCDEAYDYYQRKGRIVSRSDIHGLIGDYLRSKDLPPCPEDLLL